MTELSEKVTKFLEELCEVTSIPIDNLTTVFKKYYEASKEDPQFKSPEQLESYLITVMRGKYESRSPAIPRQIIPIGMDQIRKNKDGDLYSGLYAIDGTKKLRRVVFNGDVCEHLQDIQLFYPYKDVPLADYSKSDDLMADQRVDFSNLVDNKLDPMKVLDVTNAKKLTLKDILESVGSDERKLKQEILSRVDDRGWPIKTDWRAIHGVINIIVTKSSDEDITNSGWLSLKDNTLDVSKDIFDTEGNKLNKNIRVWISPLVAYKLTQNSEAWILGTLNQNPKTKEVTMNGCCIIPTILSPFGELE